MIQKLKKISPLHNRSEIRLQKKIDERKFIERNDLKVE